MIYWLLLFSIPIIAFLAKDNVSSRNRAFIFSALLLITLSSLRSNSVGIDLINYIPRFMSLQNTPWKYIFNTQWEPGYMVFTKLLNSIASNEQFYLFATSIATLTGVFVYIKRHSPIPWLSLFIFVAMGQYGMTMNSIRSSIALSILLLGVKYLIERKLLYFSLTVFVAMLFHKSSFFFFIAYPITGIRFSAKYFISISILALLFSFFLADSIISYFRINIFDSYSEEGTISTMKGEGYNLAIVLFALTLVCYYIYKYHGNMRNSKVANIFFQLMFLAVFFQIITPHMAGLSRISRVFYSSYLVLIPMIIQYCFKGNIKKIALLCSIVLFSIYMSYTFLSISETHTIAKGRAINNQGTIPYRFFWE